MKLNILFASWMIFCTSAVLGELKGELLSSSSELRSGIVILELLNDCRHYDVLLGERCFREENKEKLRVTLLRKDPNKHCMKKKTMNIQIVLNDAPCVPDFLLVTLDGNSKLVRVIK